MNWSKPIDSEHVSRLILLQQLKKLGLVEYSPLDDPEYVAAAGGEVAVVEERNGYVVYPVGVEGWKQVQGVRGNWLLERLKELEIYKIELRLLDRFERGVLSRVAEVMEMDRKARLRFKAGWMKKERQRQGVKRMQAVARIRNKLEREYMAKQQAANNDPPKREEPAKEELVVEEVIGGEKEAARDQKEVPSVLDSGDERPERPEVPAPSGVEVELEVIRVGPNPRVVVCEYKLLADRVRVNVWVKSNVKFRRGMKWVLKEQAGGEWGYEGKLPRYVGRW